MTTDPATPEGRAEIQARAERAQAARSDIARCEFLRVTPSRHSHRQVAASQADVPALLDALDDAECEIERQRGDLVIERRRAEAAEAALGRVRELHPNCKDRCGICHACNEVYPCRTICALDGTS